jgi:signal transduction histidine kinase
MKTLRARLVSGYSLMVTLTVAVTLVAGFFLVRRQLLNGADFLLEAEFKEIEARIAQIEAPVSSEEVAKSIGHHALIDAPFFFFQVSGRNRDLLFRSANLGNKVLPVLEDDQESRSTVLLDGLGHLRVRQFEAGPIKVQVATSLNHLAALSQRFVRASIVAIPAVLLFSLGIGYVLCEITLRPLRSIEQAARRISVSNLKERIPLPRTKDEIARLAELLNAMFDRLEQSFEQIKQFTADFSHELRTPLSIISLHAEKVMKRSNLDRESAGALAEVLSEARRLNQIIDQLLTLAKAEAQTLPLNVVQHSTSRFIEDFAEDAAALAEAAGKQFVLRENEEKNVAFDASWIRQVLFNLLSNAIKFSPPGGKIELSSRLVQDQWRLSMADEGPGIPLESREAVFDRFKQIRHSAEQPQGSGLGLAVSKSIVELHRGNIRCEKRNGARGAMIVVTLPGAMG